MAWRIHQSVVRGEIDNRVKGTVTGEIWLEGRDDPVELKLEGNAWRDLAGHRLTFENPNPEKPDDEHTQLNARQEGITGDMTASRKVRVFDIPLDEALKMSRRGEKPPEHLANSLYIEWYSDANGRVVIESADYRLTLSEPDWLMTEEEEADQCRSNAEAAGRWIERLTGAVSAAERRAEISEEEESQGWTPEDDEPMDEFQWEKFMKESDARTDKLMELYEKYEGMDSEDREHLIAREMGWTHIEEHLDAEAEDRSESDDAPVWEIPDFDDIPDPEPDPLTEGKVWIRDDDGRPVHPLYRRTFNLVSEFRTDCKEAGFLDENTNSSLHDLIFSAHMVTAKLAGGLNSLWMDRDPDGGFVVACLKRSLKFFNEAMQNLQKVREKAAADPKRLSRFHKDLCGVREDILRLMDEYRNHLR